MRSRACLRMKLDQEGRVFLVSDPRAGLVVQAYIDQFDILTQRFDIGRKSAIVGADLHFLVLTRCSS